MEIFKSELSVYSCEAEQTGETISLNLSCEINVKVKRLESIKSAFSKELLKLGYYFIDSDGRRSIFEGRGRSVDNGFSGKKIKFLIEIPLAGIQSSKAVTLAIGFLYEDAFWFSERGEEPVQLRVDLQGSRIKVTNLTSKTEHLTQGIKRQELSYSSTDPSYLDRFSDSLRSVAEKFGFHVAIEMAYEQILNRSADPSGLLAKVDQILHKRFSMRDICSQMINSDEYRARKIQTHRDPAFVKSWVQLDE